MLLRTLPKRVSGKRYNFNKFNQIKKSSQEALSDFVQINQKALNDFAEINQKALCNFSDESSKQIINQSISLLNKCSEQVAENLKEKETVSIKIGVNVGIFSIELEKKIVNE